MDKLETLASVLSALSGSPSVYVLEKPRDVDNNCIVYKQISSVPQRSLSGTMFEKTRIQLDVWSTTFTANRALVLIVKNGLDLNTSNFMISYLDNDITLKDIETNLYRTILDFFIW